MTRSGRGARSHPAAPGLRAGAGNARQGRQGDASTQPTRSLPELRVLALALLAGCSTALPPVDRETFTGMADASVWLNLKTWPPSPLVPVELL
jgi:hypothetical protein